MPAEEGIARIVSATHAPALQERASMSVPAHLTGALAAADALRPKDREISPDDPLLIRSVVVEAADSRQSIRTSPEVLSILTKDAQLVNTYGDLQKAVDGIYQNFATSGAFNSVDFRIAPISDLPIRANSVADLHVQVKEKTVSGSAGTEYTASGHANFQMKFGVFNTFGIGDSASIDIAGAPSGFSLSDLSRLTDATTGVASAIQPSFAVSFRRPTAFGGLNPVEIKLRTFAERADPMQGFSTKVRDLEASISDSSLSHSLSYTASWRNIIPLADPTKLFSSASSAPVIADSVASVKSSVSYSLYKNFLKGQQIPCWGSKWLLNLELAGFGGDVKHVKAQAACQMAASIGRYMPDTGYQTPVTSGLWHREQSGTLSDEEKMLLFQERSTLRPNPANSALPILSGAHAAAVADARATTFLTEEKRWQERGHAASQGAAATTTQYPWSTFFRGWLASGATLIFDAKFGSLKNFTVPPYTGSTHVCDRFYLTGMSMRGFESVGLRQEKKAGGTAFGDAMGGDHMFTMTGRLLLPPPFPSVRLTNSGMRTQIYSTVGSIAERATDMPLRVSAAVGAGVVFPLAPGVTLEANYTFWHSKSPLDVASRLRFQVMV